MGEIRFVGTGETRGYPYLVCKKPVYSTRCFGKVNNCDTKDFILAILNSV